MKEKEFIRQYKKKNDAIKAPQELVESTLGKMLLENERLRSGAAKKTTARRGGRYLSYFAAVAACLAVFLLAFDGMGGSLPVNVFSGDLAAIERDGAPAPQSGMQIEAWDIERYGKYIGRDLENCIKGYEYQDGVIQVWREAGEDITVDQARLNYADGNKKATLIVSMNSQVGPEAVRNGESCEVNGRVLKLGFYEDFGVYYALWEEGGVSCCLQSGDTSRGQFIRLVRGLQ